MSPVEKAYDRFLRTLCNKSRFRIIQLLRERPTNVTTIAKTPKMHQTSTSHGLARFLDCGFVTVQQVGKERLYTVNEKTIKPLMALMEKHVDTYCKRCCV